MSAWCAFSFPPPMEASSISEKDSWNTDPVPNDLFSKTSTAFLSRSSLTEEELFLEAIFNGDEERVKILLTASELQLDLDQALVDGKTAEDVALDLKHPLIADLIVEEKMRRFVEHRLKKMSKKMDPPEEEEEQVEVKDMRKRMLAKAWLRDDIEQKMELIRSEEEEVVNLAKKITEIDQMPPSTLDSSLFSLVHRRQNYDEKEALGAENADSKILDELECPVCLEDMTASRSRSRIYACSNAHLFCQRCLGLGLKSCPKCREDFNVEPPMPNRLAERWACKFRKSCSSSKQKEAGQH